MRRPLPLFSASLPSGLKMRTPKSARRDGTRARIPSDPTPVWRSQMARTAATVSLKERSFGSTTR